MPLLPDKRFTRINEISPPRNRWMYLAIALAVVIAGLLWRSGVIPLSNPVSNHGGDALWALMVFVGFGFLFPHIPTKHVAMIALSFSWGVEFSQIYHAPWIDSLRSTLPGKLILGNTFNPIDLAAYALGVGLGAAIETFLRKLR